MLHLGILELLGEFNPEVKPVNLPENTPMIRFTLDVPENTSVVSLLSFILWTTKGM